MTITPITDHELAILRAIAAYIFGDIEIEYIIVMQPSPTIGFNPFPELQPLAAYGETITPQRYVLPRWLRGGTIKMGYSEEAQTLLVVDAA